MTKRANLYLQLKQTQAFQYLLDPPDTIAEFALVSFYDQELNLIGYTISKRSNLLDISQR